MTLPDGRWAQGTSLWPRLRAPATAGETLSFSEAGTAPGRNWIKVVRDRRFTLHYAPLAGEQRWVGGAGQPWVLFDLVADPGETRNVVAEHPEEVERLKRAFGTWWRAPRFDCATDGRPCDETHPVAEETTEQLKALGYLARRTRRCERSRPLERSAAATAGRREQRTRVPSRRDATPRHPRPASGTNARR